MNRFYILCTIFCLFLMNNAANSAVYTPNQYQISNLAHAERQLFGRSLNNINPYTRLARAEQQLFGTVQSGDFNTRVNFINNVLNNSNRNRIGYYNRRNKINRLRYAVNDILRGTMTGYTPPIYNTSSINYPYYYNRYNTRIPQTPYVNGTPNFITQTRVIIDDN